MIEAFTDYDLFYDAYIETSFNSKVFVAYSSGKRLEFRPANEKDRARTECFTCLACLLRHQNISIRKKLTAGNIGHNAAQFYIGRRLKKAHRPCLAEKRIVLELCLNSRHYSSRILLSRTRNLDELVSERRPYVNFPDIDYRAKSAKRAEVFGQLLCHIGLSFKQG